MEAYYLQKYEEERKKGLRNFDPSQVGGSLPSQEDVDEFFCIPLQQSTQGEEQLVKISTNTSAADIYAHYETSSLILKIEHHMKNANRAMRRGKTVPMVVAAGIQTLLDLIPVRFKSGMNQLRCGKQNSITTKKLVAYRKKFPPGTIGFTFPKADKSKPPNHYYTQLEERTIDFVCWDLNIPNFEPKCWK